jgi:hypothetical protein
MAVFGAESGLELSKRKSPESGNADAHDALVRAHVRAMLYHQYWSKHILEWLA